MCGARDFTNEESKPFSLFKINSVSQLRELKAGHVLLKFCIVWKFSSCFYCKDQLEFFAVKPYEIQIDFMVNVRGFLVSQKVMRIVTGLLCSRNLKWFLVPVCVFFHRIQLFFFLWRCGPTRAMASSFLKFLDHTQLRITVGRTPLDE